MAEIMALKYVAFVHREHDLAAAFASSRYAECGETAGMNTLQYVEEHLVKRLSILFEVNSFDIAQNAVIK